MKSKLRKYLKIFTVLSVFIPATFFLHSCMVPPVHSQPIQTLDHFTKGMSPETVVNLFDESPKKVYDITKDGDSFTVMEYFSISMKIPVLLTFKNKELYYWAFDYVYMCSDDELISYIGNYVQNN